MDLIGIGQPVTIRVEAIRVSCHRSGSRSRCPRRHYSCIPQPVPWRTDVGIAVVCTTADIFRTLAEFVAAAGRDTLGNTAEQVGAGVDTAIVVDIDTAADRIGHLAIIKATAELLGCRAALFAGAICRTGAKVFTIAAFTQAVATGGTTDLGAVVRTTHTVLTRITGAVIVAVGRVVGGLELPHHLVVLVVEKVTVIREAAGIVLEVHDDTGRGIGRDVHDVLPGVCLPGLQRDRLTGIHIGLAHDLEAYQVNVHRVIGVRRVFELPDLALTEDRELGDIIPVLAGDVAIRAIQ